MRNCIAIAFHSSSKVAWELLDGLGASWFRGVSWGLLALWLNLAGMEVSAQVITVNTIAGGPWAGYQDGKPIIETLFSSPAGCAVDTSGNLFVADQGNNRVRKLDFRLGMTTTVLDQLSRPIDVACDTNNNLFILNQGSGTLLKLDRFNNLYTLGTFAQPTAMGLDRYGNIFVGEAERGRIRMLSATNGQVYAVMEGLGLPAGIAFLQNGSMAVSDSLRHAVFIVDPQTKTIKGQIGSSGVPGFKDGAFNIVLFNNPQRLVAIPDGGFLVADRYNNRVRQVSPAGFVITLYGVDPAYWWSNFPGWEDGDVAFVESREPVGLALAQNGTLYATEDYYHLIREINGGGFSQSPGGGSTNGTVVPPQLSLTSGYHPMGAMVYVTNRNQSAFFATAIHYTTDGTEPTTNSLKLEMTGDVGVINWREKDKDLSSLRVKAFAGAYASETVTGLPVAQSEIGISRDLVAGEGALAVVPVVVNLLAGQGLKSLQFRVELSPPAGSAVTNISLSVLSLTNDTTVSFVGPSPSPDKPAVLNWLAYTNQHTRVLSAYYLGTNANFSVTKYAVATLLAVRIPPNSAGTRFSIRVVDASGTADGLQDDVPLQLMPAREILVRNDEYLVGDASYASWFNAEKLDSSGQARTFGDQKLNNADVNSVYYASLGFRMPIPGTDLANAMDAYPVDTATAAGGDGLIRFLDWQTVLQRSLNIDTQRPKRRHGASGQPVVLDSIRPGSISRMGITHSSIPTAAAGWSRQANLSAGVVENAQLGSVVNIPVYVTVANNCHLAGLQFRATVDPDGNGPAIAQPPTFIAASGMPAPSQSSMAANILLCGWSIVPTPSFSPALQGRVFLGHIRVLLPNVIWGAQSYLVHFSYVDGAPDFSTQYNLDSIPGVAWVNGPALKPAQRVSDEWRVFYFGSVSSNWAQDDADPDGDGIANWQAYRDGVCPIKPRLNVLGSDWSLDGRKYGFKLQWFGAPGTQYLLERSDSLNFNVWTQVYIENGRGDLVEFLDSSEEKSSKVYRLRVVAPPVGG